MFSNITYVHSIAFSRHYDLMVICFWKLETTLVVIGDRLGRSRTRTVAVSRNVKGPLRAAMEYLQDASKRI